MSPAGWIMVGALGAIALGTLALRWALPMHFRWVHVPRLERSSGWRMRAIRGPRPLASDRRQSSVAPIDPSQPDKLAAGAETEVLGEFAGRTFHLVEERRVRTADANRPGKSSAVPSIHYDCTLVITATRGIEGRQPSLVEYPRLLDLAEGIWQSDRTVELATGVYTDGELLCAVWGGRAYGARLRRKLRKLAKMSEHPDAQADPDEPAP